MQDASQAHIYLRSNGAVNGALRALAPTRVPCPVQPTTTTPGNQPCTRTQPHNTFERRASACASGASGDGSRLGQEASHIGNILD